MIALYLETDHDAVTRQVHTARRDTFVGMGADDEIHLFGSRATRDLFIMKCGTKRWHLFSGMGHGGPYEFDGYDDQIIADVSNTRLTTQFFANKIVHLYSCNTANNLGIELVSQGARAFIGYNNYVLAADSVAVEKMLISVSLAIDLSILAGDNHSTVKYKAHAQYLHMKSVLIAPTSTATPTEVVAFDNNYAAMVGPWTGPQYGSF